MNMRTPHNTSGITQIITQGLTLHNNSFLRVSGSLLSAFSVVFSWVSVISELELFGKKGLSDFEIDEISYLLDSCFISEINPQIKQITKNLMQKVSVKLPDAIIAATSIYLDLPLLTADVEFEKINGLKLILLEF